MRVRYHTLLEEPIQADHQCLHLIGEQRKGRQMQVGDREINNSIIMPPNLQCRGEGNRILNSYYHVEKGKTQRSLKPRTVVCLRLLNLNMSQIKTSTKICSKMRRFCRSVVCLLNPNTTWPMLVQSRRQCCGRYSRYSTFQWSRVTLRE